MVSIRSVFRRLPSVTYSRGKYHVHGSDLELWRMAMAVMLALEQRGYDVRPARYKLRMCAESSTTGKTNKQDDKTDG